MKISFPENTNFVGINSILTFSNGLRLVLVGTGFQTVGTAIIKENNLLYICPVHNKDNRQVKDTARLTEKELELLLNTYTSNVSDIESLEFLSI